MPLDQYLEKSSFRSKALPAFVVLLLLTVLYVSSLYNYLLFHSLVEIFIFDRNVRDLMTASIVASVASELSFTQYASAFGPDLRLET
jgi:hypothetical protein